MKYFLILSFLIVFFIPSDDAFAVCCFPYDLIHHIDPITGSLVVSGELWNDSYKVEPFGNAKYEFVFYNSTGDALFERELLVTDGHPIRDGFVINPLGAHPLPFQMVIDDIDSQILNQIAHVGTGRTHVDYFSWKPTDLNATLSEFKKIETIQGQTHGTLFDKWQVSGTITNTYSEATQNVYVLASLHESEHRLVGVAGYSNDDIQPKTLEGHETKEFKIHALIPQEKSVKQVSLYAESDNSSMKYPNTKPIIIKPDAPIKHGTKGNSIPISVNVTNISRENIDFDWILQIKKSPKSLDEGDITNYPESKVAFIDIVPIDVMAQESKLLEYLWTPTTGGIYFYEMYMWDDGLPVSPAFAGSFLYSDQILVTSNSLKEQLASGVSFENLQCINNLILIQKYNDGSPVCVKSETATKLIARTGWVDNLDAFVYQKSKPVESDLLPLDIASIEDKYVHLNPVDTCATVSLRLLSSDDLKQAVSGTKEVVFFELDEQSMNEFPVLGELIRATHYIESPSNEYAQTEIGLREFVDYEFFIMKKAIAKYNDTQKDYFMKLDGNLDEKLADPKKQGFSNEFIAPQIVYHDKIYSIGSTVFWIADEHEMQSISMHLQDNLKEDEKYITLTDKDMDSVPKIKQTIEKIGTELESIVAFKGMPENPDWNNYRKWFEQKKTEQFNLDDMYVKGFVYEGEHYDLGFPIC